MSEQRMRQMPKLFWRFRLAAPGEFAEPGVYYCHVGNKKIIPLPRRHEPCRVIMFEEVTCVVAKNQPEYMPLPAHIHKGDTQGKITFCWQLSVRARLKVIITGKLWHQVLTFNHQLQPQLLTTDKPEMTA